MAIQPPESGEPSRRSRRDVLRESEERFRLLVEGVKDYAIFMLDAEGHVSTWNPGARRIKGYESGEIVGRHFSAFYTREDVDAKLKEQLQTVIDAVRRGAQGLREVVNDLHLGTRGQERYRSACAPRGETSSPRYPTTAVASGLTPDPASGWAACASGPSSSAANWRSRANRNGARAYV